MMKAEIIKRDFVMIALLVVVMMSLSVDYFVTSYDQTNITSRVNITNAGPEILTIVINDGNNIDLNEGTTKSVDCNITVRDFNGWTDINYLNATLFSTDFSTRDALLDNNTNYYLETPNCTNTSVDANTAIFTCTFDVYYYAYNGTWECNASVTDVTNYNYNNANTSTINPLYAINVTSLVDYGDMAVGDTSTSSEIANITNFGNMDINISIFGFGGDNYATGNGLAFICQEGNITAENERWDLIDQAWAAMNPLTNESVMIPGLTVQNQDDDNPVINSTFWRLYVPPNPFGECNGTLVFEAELP